MAGLSLKPEEQLAAALAERKQSQRYRTRRLVESPQGIFLQSDGKKYLNFCSNDYLGLANHPKVKQAFIAATEKYGVGSGASHLVNGHSFEHHALEEELAEFAGRERALLFSTGYMANMGVINALTGKGDSVIEDKLNHASLLDGALLSRADLLRFKHNDVQHAEVQLQKNPHKTKLLAVDGVFSMDGDMAPLPELARLCQAHNAWLLVDDAHAFGCLGAHGGGTTEYFSLNQQEVPILIGTLGKAFGTFGAFVAGSSTLIEGLIQFARTYIYTTALPPAVAAATRASLKILKQESWRREKLHTLIKLFREGCGNLGLQLLPSQSAIQPVLLGDDARALRLSSQLLVQGIWVSAIRPPTVPEGSARLRVTFCAEHEEVHVRQLLDALEKSGAL